MCYTGVSIIMNKKILLQENLLIYGAGELARGISELLPEVCDNKILGFAVTSMDNNPKIINGLCVKSINNWDVDTECTGVFLGLSAQYWPEAEKILIQHGYKYIYKQNVDMSLLLNKAFKLKMSRFLCKDK